MGVLRFFWLSSLWPIVSIEVFFLIVQTTTAWTTTVRTYPPSLSKTTPLNDEQCKRYAQRLGLDTDALQQGGASASKLRDLTEAHLSRIPFDNLRVFGADENAPLSMQPQSVANALIDRQRGGVCFELNGLFGNFLNRLGYDVTHVPASFLEFDKQLGEFKDSPHLFLTVNDEMGQRWLVDVGMGSTSPIHPLALVMNQEQHTPEGMRSRLVEHSPTQTRLEIYDCREEHWLPRVEFSTHAMTNDQASSSATSSTTTTTTFQQSHLKNIETQTTSLEDKAMQYEDSLEDVFAEGSDFRRMPVVVKLTRTEMVALVGSQLKVTHKRHGTDIEATTYDCKNVEEVRRILEMEFGIPWAETDQLTVPGL